MANYLNNQHFILDGMKKLSAVSLTQDKQVVKDFLDHLLQNVDDYRGKDVDHFVSVAMKIVSQKTIELG